MNIIPGSFPSLYSDMSLQSDEIMFSGKMLQLVDQLEMNGSILLIILTILFYYNYCACTFRGENFRIQEGVENFSI